MPWYKATGTGNPNIGDKTHFTYKASEDVEALDGVYIKKENKVLIDNDLLGGHASNARCLYLKQIKLDNKDNVIIAIYQGATVSSNPTIYAFAYKLESDKTVYLLDSSAVSSYGSSYDSLSKFLTLAEERGKISVVATMQNGASNNVTIFELTYDISVEETVDFKIDLKSVKNISGYSFIAMLNNVVFATYSDSSNYGSFILYDNKEYIVSGSIKIQSSNYATNSICFIEHPTKKYSGVLVADGSNLAIYYTYNEESKTFDLQRKIIKTNFNWNSTMGCKTMTNQYHNFPIEKPYIYKNGVYLVPYLSAGYLILKIYSIDFNEQEFTILKETSAGFFGKADTYLNFTRFIYDFGESIGFAKVGSNGALSNLGFLTLSKTNDINLLSDEYTIQDFFSKNGMSSYAGTYANKVINQKELVGLNVKAIDTKNSVGQTFYFCRFTFCLGIINSPSDCKFYYPFLDRDDLGTSAYSISNNGCFFYGVDKIYKIKDTYLLFFTLYLKYGSASAYIYRCVMCATKEKIIYVNTAPEKAGASLDTAIDVSSTTVPTGEIVDEELNYCYFVAGIGDRAFNVSVLSQSHGKYGEFVGVAANDAAKGEELDIVYYPEETEEPAGEE